ncbi:TetR/AcrR family transcriptional regulator [Nocardia blacklockiae]|nr:TetR/AcrR family transcriptional regulator [Nocardia blacklockiae]
MRERKKQATREALREAALRLALERGPGNVRVDDIAEAAGVSPRTYNNYFSSREQAIVAAVTAEREARVAAAVAARDGVRLSEAVVDAIVEQYTDPGAHGHEALLMITRDAGLRETYLGTATVIAGPLADVFAARLDDSGENDLTARVLAAGVAAAVRVALEQWVRPVSGGLVVVSGSLPELLRAALRPLAPALDAADRSGKPKRQ